MSGLSPQDYMQNVHGKEIDLLRTTVKVPGKRPPRAVSTCAAMQSPNTNGLTKDMSSLQLGPSQGETSDLDPTSIINPSVIQLVMMENLHQNLLISLEVIPRWCWKFTCCVLMEHFIYLSKTKVSYQHLEFLKASFH